MTTQAFNKDYDNILKKVLATSELAKFETQILEATSCLSNERHSELIINLCNVIFQQHLTIKKQAEKIEDLQNKLAAKNVAISTYRTMLFGSQSEKAKTLGQQDGPDDKINSNVPDTKEDVPPRTTKDQSEKGEQPPNSKKKNKRKYKKPPKRNKIPSKIPRVRIHHNAPCHCPSCGEAFKELKNMYAKSEELGIKVIFYAEEHLRAKMAPNCECSGNARIYTSPKVGSVVFKGKYSNSLISYLLMNKFYVQIPLHRQCTKLFSSYGAELSESTVIDTFKYLHAQVLPQLYNAIKIHTLDSKHFHADETSWKVFVDKEGKKTFNHWIWVVASKNGIYYIYDPSRSKSVVLKTFAPDASGLINVDRFASYNALPEGIKRAFCWYHMRRDFIRLARALPQLRSWCLKWLKSIRKIEKLNTKRFDAYNLLDVNNPLSEEFVHYHKRLHKLLTAFYNRASKEFHEDENLHGQAQKVLKSLIKHWDGYVIFYEFPFVPMHNNYSERLLRAIANARNNFLGSHAPWSAELMAMVLSICETSRLYGLNPYIYMEYFLAQCSKYEDRQIPDLSAILPWNVTTSVLEHFNSTNTFNPMTHSEKEGSIASHSTTLEESIVPNASEKEDAKLNLFVHIPLNPVRNSEVISANEPEQLENVQMSLQKSQISAALLVNENTNPDPQDSINYEKLHTDTYNPASSNHPINKPNFKDTMPLAILPYNEISRSVKLKTPTTRMPSNTSLVLTIIFIVLSIAQTLFLQNPHEASYRKSMYNFVQTTAYTQDARGMSPIFATVAAKRFLTAMTLTYRPPNPDTS